MKASSLPSLTVVAIVCLMLSFNLNLFAGPNPEDLLIQAYVKLEQADHDYKGHRADAMKEIEAAGKLVGVNVRGDGRGHERQGVSDEQLRTARELLEQARGGLHGKALARVDKAIKQISIALKIK
ncbi:MAG: hypothetical protein JWQ04_2142 [Pedosphaera sp.]|nr:hypothetical protein [Pedosphaera sp.]